MTPARALAVSTLPTAWRWSHVATRVGASGCRAKLHTHERSHLPQMLWPPPLVRLSLMLLWR